MNKMKITKKMILTVLIAVSALLTSCSKDDDNNDPNIVGEWKLVSRVSENFKNNVSTGSRETEITTEKNFETYTFKSDKTFTDYYAETYADSNGTGVTETFTENGTYLIDGNMLSLTYVGDTEADKRIFTVTNTQLTIVYKEEYTSGADTHLYKVTTTYTRQ